MNKVFIVEDDAVIARAVAAHLTTWQMQVQCAGNFEKITEEVANYTLWMNRSLRTTMLNTTLPAFKGRGDTTRKF